MAGLKLIVGLGNPGPEHARTRHNAGFWFIDALAEKLGGRFGLESKLHGQTAKVHLGGATLWLLRPATFMNLSGRSVTAALRYWKIEPEECLVAHDDLDLPPGAARLKFDGGHGGQNGLRDTMRLLGHGRFHRLRVGIGHPGHKDRVTPWVLGKPGTDDEVAIQEEINTFKGVNRIIRHAFEFARASGRRKVCMADKSNAMQQGHALWQRVFKEVSAQYPGIAATHQYIDALAMFLVRDPGQYQVIVTNNLFGDIVTDIGGALQGGLGMAASGNIHPGKTSLFEPVHGSAPPLAGKNVANPIGAILSTALLLETLGAKEESKAIEASVEAAVAANQVTSDIGGTLGTSQSGDVIAAHVKAEGTRHKAKN